VMALSDGGTLAAVLFPFGRPAAQPATSPDRTSPSYFLVASWGHSGSIWLAGSLNFHEAMCATVGVYHPAECFAYYPMHRDANYVACNAPVELGRHGFSVWSGNLDSSLRCVLGARGITFGPRDTSQLPSYVFDELDLLPAVMPYSVLGNVHGMTLGQLHQAYLAEPNIFRNRGPIVLDLIRHPVGRTESAINATVKYHLHNLEPLISEFIHTHADECLALERTFKIDFSDPRARAALHVYRQGLQNDVWAYEVREFPNTYRLLLERLQAEPEYFAHAFYTLTHGRLVADQTHLDRVFAEENLGTGRQSTTEHARPLAPREQYERWSPFERAEFARVSQRLGAPALYFPFGYDFSFVTRGAGDYGSWFMDMCVSNPGS